MLTGCVTKGDLRDVRGEVRDLAAQQDSLLNLLLRLERSSQDSIRAQSDILFSIRGELTRQLLDIQEQLVTVQELTGQSQRSLAGLRDQIESRRSSVQQPGGGTARDTTGGRESTGERPRQDPPDAGGVQELYNVAVRQFNRGSLNTARSAFERFLQTYPNHRLAADAHFYLADILVQENEIEEALKAFLEIPELFPTAAKVPDALWRAGLLELERGNTEEARSLFERVVNTYPDSGAAELARERLDELP